MPNSFLYARDTYIVVRGRLMMERWHLPPFARYRTIPKISRKIFTIGTKPSPPYRSMMISGNACKKDGKNYDRINICKDHVYDAPQSSALSRPSLPTKVWEIPFDEVTSEGLLLSSLQNEAVRESIESGFVNAILLYNLLSRSGVTEAFKNIGISEVEFRGILSFTFTSISSGRLLITDSLCASLFFRTFAMQLKRQIPLNPTTAHQLWHIILSGVFFYLCGGSSGTIAFKFDKGRAEELADDFMRKESRPALRRKLKFLKHKR